MHVIISKDPHRAAWDLSYGPGQSDRSFGSLAAALEFAAADGAGLKVEILGPKDMQKLGFGALLGVAQGSANSCVLANGESVRH